MDNNNSFKQENVGAKAMRLLQSWGVSREKYCVECEVFSGQLISGLVTHGKESFFFFFPDTAGFSAVM